MASEQHQREHEYAHRIAQRIGKLHGVRIANWCRPTCHEDAKFMHLPGNLLSVVGTIALVDFGEGGIVETTIEHLETHEPD